MFVHFWISKRNKFYLYGLTLHSVNELILVLIVNNVQVVNHVVKILTFNQGSFIIFFVILLEITCNKIIMITELLSNAILLKASKINYK